MQKISHEIDGVMYEASFEVFGDELVVYLPDESTKQTTLRGMMPALAAKPHLVSSAKSQHAKQSIGQEKQ